MLCERHVNGAGEEEEEEEEETEAHARRATKRVTRFIDLGEFGGSDLR